MIDMHSLVLYRNKKKRSIFQGCTNQTSEQLTEVVSIGYDSGSRDNPWASESLTPRLGLQEGSPTRDQASLGGGMNADQRKAPTSRLRSLTPGSLGVAARELKLRFDESYPGGMK